MTPGWYQGRRSVQHYFKSVGRRSAVALCGLLALTKSLQVSNNKALPCRNCERDLIYRSTQQR